MSKCQGRPSDDECEAPESGTVRDETSGNQPANPHERGIHTGPCGEKPSADDPSFAGEER